MRVTGDDGVDPRSAEGDATACAARDDADLGRLVALAANGDRASLEHVLHLIRPPVLRYCVARMGGPASGVQAPEDVAQEILLAVCGALPTYRAGEVPVMAFVYGIARFKVADAFRAAGRDRSQPTENLPEEADTGRGPELEAVLGSEAGELRALLELLPDSYREVLVLRVALGYSAEETALVVGSTAGAVRVTQHRALVKLRKLVAERDNS